MRHISPHILAIFFVPDVADVLLVIARFMYAARNAMPNPRLPQRRSERLPTLHCDCVSYKMAEFSFGSRVFTVFLCDIFTGLES